MNPGAALASARRAAGLSVADVAAQLRLSPRQVQALEADRYEDLPGAVFVRGFIRNYARLLKLDPASLLDALEPELVQDAPLRVRETSGTLPLAGRRDRARPLLIVFCLILAAALAAGGYELWSRQAEQRTHTASSQTSAPPVAVQQEQVQQPAPTVVESRGPGSAYSPAPPAPSEPAVTATPVEPVAQAAPGAPSQQRTGRLRVQFAADSWIEVRDREGVMYIGTGAAGSERLFEGLAPLTVVIGNAKGVRITYNDQPLDLSAHAARNIARLTLE